MTSSGQTSARRPADAVPPAGSTTSARDAILDATVEVLLRDGLHGARLEDIAAVAGVSLGLLPYHFGSKKELLRAGLLATLSRLSEDGAGTSDPLAIARLGVSDPRWVRIRSEALREAVFDDEVREAVRAATGRWEERITQAAPVDARVATVLTAIADGVRQRVSTDLLRPADGIALLDAAGAVLGAARSEPGTTGASPAAVDAARRP